MAGKTFSTQVTSVTQDKIVGKVVETVLNGNVLTLRFLNNAQKWMGHEWTIPVKNAKNTSGGSYTSGDLFSTTAVDTRTTATHRPTFNYQSVVLDNPDRAVNNSATVVDFVKAAMEEAALDMTDRLGGQFYGTGTGNDIVGLGAAVDDGTAVSSYGGITYSGNTYWNSSVTTSVGALGVDNMASAFDAAQVGSDAPTMIVTTPAVWTAYEGLLQPGVTANYNAAGFPQLTRSNFVPSRNALAGEIGFNALFYRGVPVVSDEKCTSGYMYFLNEKYLGWHGLSHPVHGSVSFAQGTHDTPAYTDVSRNLGFSWTGLKEPTNQDASIGQFILYGNLINRSPRMHAVLQGVT